MPKIQAERLSEIGRALFIAVGTPPAEAEIVMRHVVAANLANRNDVSTELKRKIFFDNPQRFYGIEVDPAAFAAA